MRKAAARALEMVTSLLSFTEGRFGGFALAPRLTNVRELCRELLDELALSHPGAQLAFEAAGECVCTCDPGRLAQAVINLVTNALQYGATGRPVRISVDIVEDGKLGIEVHNEGPAIPQPLLAELFEPFRRGPQRSGRVRGLGLGLYIVREIARAHGGAVAVTSDAGAGTRFRITLPR